MKKFLSLLILSIILGLSINAGATTIVDNYYGKEDHGYGDVIGQEASFGISKMEVSYDSTGLTADIYSRYLNNIGALETALTDLFISTDGWNPSGSAPYLSDDLSNGEIWEYALVMDNHLPSSNSGTISLYSIPYDGSRNPSSLYGQAIATSDEIFDIGTYRNNQEVQLNITQDTEFKATGAWNIIGLGDGDDTNDFIRFMVDYDFQATDPLAFHYASATCANEVIEGQVPEPATLLLSGLGLLGMGCFFSRKIKKV